MLGARRAADGEVRGRERSWLAGEGMVLGLGPEGADAGCT